MTENNAPLPIKLEQDEVLTTFGNLKQSDGSWEFRRGLSDVWNHPPGQFHLHDEAIVIARPVKQPDPAGQKVTWDGRRAILTTTQAMAARNDLTQWEYLDRLDGTAWVKFDLESPVGLRITPYKPAPLIVRRVSDAAGQPAHEATEFLL